MRKHNLKNTQALPGDKTVPHPVFSSQPGRAFVFWKGGIMWPTMIANIFIEVGWIAATVILILNNHPVWAGFCLVAALFSGYSFKNK